MSLTSAQRRHLRSLGHHLDPAVLVGGNGITDGVIQAVEEALAARELIKVRLDAERDTRKTMAEELASRTEAEIAQSIGKIVLLFRPARDKAKRAISLPG